jgi:hypothetical protein
MPPGNYSKQQGAMKANRHLNPSISTTIRADSRALHTVTSLTTQSHSSTTNKAERQSARFPAPKTSSPTCPSTPTSPSGQQTGLTIYDEHDRPTEVRIHDSQGEVVSRAIRTYDPQGCIAEEKLVYDDIVTMLSVESLASILEASDGPSLDEFRAELTKFMGGQSGPASIAIIYDPQGRIRRKTRRAFNIVNQIEITYNEHGDETIEITRTTQDGNPEQYSESHCEYQYDEHANWTEKLDSWCSMPGATRVPSTKTHRTLTYF